MTRDVGDRRPTEATPRIAGERDGQARREFQGALKAAESATPLVEPTAEEARNGWTAETLTAYVQEQRAAQSLRVDPQSAMNRQGRRPKRANSKYNPLRWRG